MDLKTVSIAIPVNFLVRSYACEKREARKGGNGKKTFRRSQIQFLLCPFQFVFIFFFLIFDHYQSPTNEPIYHSINHLNSHRPIPKIYQSTPSIHPSNPTAKPNQTKQKNQHSLLLFSFLFSGSSSSFSPPPNICGAMCIDRLKRGDGAKRSLRGGEGPNFLRIVGCYYLLDSFLFLLCLLLSKKNRREKFTFFSPSFSKIRNGKVRVRLMMKKKRKRKETKGKGKKGVCCGIARDCIQFASCIGTSSRLI